jgi:hypothetical protein
MVVAIFMVALFSRLIAPQTTNFCELGWRFLAGAV